MTFRSMSACELGVLGCLVASLFACGGTQAHGTETDNPAPNGRDAGTPAYDSPGDFGSGPSGQLPCPAPADDGKPRQLALWGRAGSLLIGASPYHGLIVVDTSDAESPALRGETPLPGEPHQLIVGADAQVTLAIDQVPVGAHDSVLTPTELQPAPRLVRFDASDPSAVKRSGDIAIEGEFWSMRARGSTVWVMSARVADPVTSCNRGPYDCGFVERTALIVAGYQWDGGAWKRVARSELPSSGPAWELSDGYAAYEQRLDDHGNFQSAALRFVRFDGDDALGQPGEVALPGRVAPGAPIGLSASVLHVFILNYEDGHSELDTIAVDSGELLSKLDHLTQPRSDATVFSGERVFLDGASDGSAVRMVDFSDERAPDAQSFPDGVTRVVPLGAGTQLLGLSDPGPWSSELRASLFALKNGSPVQLAQVMVNQGHGAVGLEDVHVIGDEVIIGYQSSSDFRRVRVALAVSGTQLVRLGEIDAGDADDILASDTTFYAPDADALRTGSLQGGAAHVLAWAHEVIDELQAGAYRATLTRGADRRGVVELSRAGKLVTSLDVGPDPERLIGDDERVLVLSLEPREQCAQTGLDCSDYAPNVAIVTLADTPQISATVPLADPDALGASADGGNRINWDIGGDVALALGHGQFVLIGDYQATCARADECAALGVDIQAANQTMTAPGSPATPPCAPGASCPAAPAVTPGSASSGVSGSKRATRLYLLDATAAKPQFAAPVDSVLEQQNSRFATPRVSDDTLMITRIERPYVPGTDSDGQPAHFMLDRFVAMDGKLHALPPVNVPGLPIALADGGARLFSAEPDANTHGAGTLYMLALDDSGARTLDSTSLPPSYSSAVAAFGKIFYLSHDGTDCAGKSTLLPFAMPDTGSGKLVALRSLELPGGRYQIADARDNRLLLADDRSHYVVVDISGDTPKLVTFLSAAVGPARPMLQGDSVIGAPSFYPDALSFR